MHEALLRQIEAALPTARWLSGPPPGPGARSFKGTGGGWVFLVVAFSIEDQGFPPGSLGYDGTAMRGGTIVRLTRSLAERAVKLAEAGRS